MDRQSWSLCRGEHGPTDKQEVLAAFFFVCLPVMIGVSPCYRANCSTPLLYDVLCLFGVGSSRSVREPIGSS